MAGQAFGSMNMNIANGWANAEHLANQQANIREDELRGRNSAPRGNDPIYDYKMSQKSGGGGGQSPTLLNANYSQEQFDPWSRYRAQAGDLLAGGMDPANDPSNAYKDRLEGMLSPGGGDFQTNDPSYLFRLQQGQQALERSQGAKGLLGSGNAAIELQNYGQNAASQEYGAQFNRLLQGMQGVSQQYDTQQQRLMQMAGINLDPTAAAKMNLGVEGINTDRINGSNSYNLGMQNSADNRYATDVGASTSRYNSDNSTRPGTFDTQSMFAGSAADAVDSAKWWAGKRSTDTSFNNAAY